MALVPLSYNLRSLFGRPSSTVLTIFSIGATVAVLAGVLSLQQGFAAMFAERGRTDLAVFLRDGALSEGESGFSTEVADLLIKETPEIALGEDGQPLAAAELFLAVRRFKVDGGETNVPIRGVEPRTFAIHGDELRIVDGQRFAPGADEVIVGLSLVDRIRDCRVGDVLMLNSTPFRVAGVFTARGSYQSEIWGDLDRMREALQRPTCSRVIGVLRPEVDPVALGARLETNPRVQVDVKTERDYLQSQTTATSQMFFFLGGFLAVLMGLAAVFTGTNAMLAAIAARTREIGILLSFGFRPWALFVSFLLEALVIGALGGVVGCVLVLPLNGVRTGTMNFQTFTEIAFAFKITPFVLGWAIGFAVLLGLIGGMWPAWRAARLTPTQALRRA